MEKLIQVESQDRLEVNIRRIMREEIVTLIKEICTAKVEDKILTKKEVLELYGICSTSLWNRMREGSIPYFKVGRRVYFRSSELGLTPSSLDQSILKKIIQ